MALSKKEKALEILLQNEYIRTLKLTKTELLRILNFDQNEFNSTTINRILEQSAIRIERVNQSIFKLKVNEILGASFSLDTPLGDGLRQVLNERSKIIQRQLVGYGQKLRKAADTLIELKKSPEYDAFIKRTDKAFLGSRIFRRRFDKPQNFAISILQRTFLTGNPATMGKTELYKKIFSDPELNKTFQKNGRWSFNLEIWPYDGKTFRNYDIEKYSEMAARTAATLAEQESFVAQAAEFGTTLLKYNRTGISKRKYINEGDPICAEIDGNVYSSIPGQRYFDKKANEWKRGTQGASGKWYEYIRDVIGSTFLTPHPNCDHIAKPTPNAAH